MPFLSPLRSVCTMAGVTLPAAVIIVFSHDFSTSFRLNSENKKAARVRRQPARTLTARFLPSPYIRVEKALFQTYPAIQQKRKAQQLKSLGKSKDFMFFLLCQYQNRNIEKKIFENFSSKRSRSGIGTAYGTQEIVDYGQETGEGVLSWSCRTHTDGKNDRCNK